MQPPYGNGLRPCETKGELCGEPEKKNPVLAPGRSGKFADFLKNFALESHGGGHQKAPAQEGMKAVSLDAGAIFRDEKISTASLVPGLGNPVSHLKAAL